MRDDLPPTTQEFDSQTEWLLGVVTGYLAQSLRHCEALVIDVTIPKEADGTYIPEIHVTGMLTGVRLCISVQVMPELSVVWEENKVLTPLFTCRCGQTLTAAQNEVLSCCEDHEHEHVCIIAREHSPLEPCLCSCGATRTLDTPWDEP